LQIFSHGASVGMFTPAMLGIGAAAAAYGAVSFLKER
jgi:hypothetical protein